MKGNSDLNALATSLGAEVQPVAELQFGSFSIPGLGPELDVMGTAFALPVGVVSDPIKGNMGVYVIKVEQTSDKATNNNPIATKLELEREFKVD